MARMVAHLDRHIGKRERELRQWFRAIFIAPLGVMAFFMVLLVVILLLGGSPEGWREDASSSITAVTLVAVLGWYLQKRNLADLKVLRAAVSEEPLVEDAPPRPASADVPVTTRS